MVEGAAATFVDVIAEGILNCNSRIATRKLRINLNYNTTIVETFEICHVAKPLQGYSCVQLVLCSLLLNRYVVVSVGVGVGC